METVEKLLPDSEANYSKRPQRSLSSNSHHNGKTRPKSRSQSRHSSYQTKSTTKLRLINSFTIPFTEIVANTKNGNTNGENAENGQQPQLIDLNISDRCPILPPGLRIQLQLQHPLTWRVTTTAMAEDEESSTSFIPGSSRRTSNEIASIYNDSSEITTKANKHKSSEEEEEENEDLETYCSNSLCSSSGIACKSSTTGTTIKNTSFKMAKISDDESYCDSSEQENKHPLNSFNKKILESIRTNSSVSAQSFSSRKYGQHDPGINRSISNSSSSSSKKKCQWKRKASSSSLKSRLHKQIRHQNGEEMDYTSDDSGLSADSETSNRSEEDKIIHYQQRGYNLHNELESGEMGANESRLTTKQKHNQKYKSHAVLNNPIKYKQHNGTSSSSNLKSRCQSSSALHCISASATNNGFEESFYEQHNNTPYSSSNGLNGTIPMHIWDLPANSQSFSPSRLQKYQQQQQQQYPLPNKEQSFIVGNCHQLYYEQFQNPQQQFIDGRQQSQRRSYKSAKNTTTSSSSYLYTSFPFITEDKIFDVHLIRDPRNGLGLSVTGGADTEECYPGLIRIKKIFPMGPAFHSGRLQPMDIILKANGVPLTGLTNPEALEVLRTTPTQTILTLYRPPNNIPGLYFQEEKPRLSSSETSLHYHQHAQNLQGKSLQEQQHQQPHHQQSCSYHHYQNPISQQGSYPSIANAAEYGYISSISSNTNAFNHSSVKSKSMSSLKTPPPKRTTYGEFEITLEKVGGSLGFTLKQEDNSVLGHYVRALVKDPALSDGRIIPGDRILSVNGQDLSEMNHEQAIRFLRCCPAEVKLRIFRDVANTPLSPLSPSESHKSIKPKQLRQEAIDMLSDLAMRRKMSGSSSEPNKKDSTSSSGILSRNSGGLVRVVQSKSSVQSQINADAVNGPATIPRRRHAGVTPSPKVLSAALDRFAGKNSTPKLNQSQQENLPEEGESSNMSTNSNSNKIRRESGLGSSNTSFPSETRSSGSGESTPAGTISQCRGENISKNTSRFTKNTTNNTRNLGHHGVMNAKKNASTPLSSKTDLHSALQFRTNARNDEDDSDNSSWCENGEDEDNDDDVLINEEEEEQLGKNKKQLSLRQYTLHLDRISSFEDDSIIDLKQMDNFTSESRFGKSPSHEDKFRHGQPSYQSAILHSTSSKLAHNNSFNRKRNLSLSHENIEKLQQTLGHSSRTQLCESPVTGLSSDADVQSSSSSILMEPSSNQTQQTSLASYSGNTSSGMKKEGAGNLLKWKGVMLSQSLDKDDELYSDSEKEETEKAEDDDKGNLEAISLRGACTSHETPEGQSSSNNLCSTSSPSTSSKSSNSRRQMTSTLRNREGGSGRLPQRQSPDGHEVIHDSTDELSTIEISQTKHLPTGEQIFNVQLSRRWCSRLGFSLKGSNGHSFISAIYSDSVAGRDGRLRVGDEVIMVNQVSVRDIPTTEVIDMMRKTRGMISITILRKPLTPEDEDVLNSSDHQLGLT